MKNHEILIQKLKTIQDNSNAHSLTHTDIIIFCRTVITAIENDNLLENNDLSSDAIAIIVFHLKLISTYGINHRYRSYLAKKCVKYIENYLEKQKNSQPEWDEIPF